MSPQLLCVGGEDHHLRIPFLLALRSRGFKIVAAGTGDPSPFVRARIVYHPFRFERFVNPLSDWTTLGTLSKLVAEVPADIVHSFDTKPNLLVPLAARGRHDVAIVRTLNGLGWVYSSRSPLALALRPMYRGLHRLAARSTTATVFQNRDDQVFFERYGMIGKGESRLIPGSGIDVQRFDEAVAGSRSATQLRRELNLGQSELVITVTRITRQKGIPTLLEAAAIVHQHRPEVRFLLVGPRESEGRLAVTQAQIDRHSAYVKAIGPRSDVPALLRLADVCAFPTEYREGVPRALLEAALAGLPIVTTQMPGCCDVVCDAWNGYLVPPRSPRLLADRILRLLQDRETARAMGARAAQLVRTRFNLGITVSRYMALYDDLMGRLGRDQPQAFNDATNRELAPQGAKARNDA